jgi:acetyl esterase/lipase
MYLAEKFPVLALGLIVPLFDTNPSSKQDPWGKNEDVPGLSTRYLLSSLEETFKGVSRHDWNNNPSEMPDFVREKLPPMCIAVAEFDPLYRSGKEFADRQKALAEQKIAYMEFRGIHQVKDLHQETAEGRNLRAYLVRCLWSLWSEQHQPI